MSTPIRTLLTLLLLTAALAATAIPARRSWRVITLADGSRAEVCAVGDEHGHWLTDRQGRALAGGDGTARYMDAPELSQRRATAQARRAQANSRRAARLARAKGPETRAAGGTTYSGEKRGLVILVSFADRAMTATRQAIDNAFNQEGYSEDHHAGSVHDYFYDQSYGKFSLSFDVVGPYTVSKPMAYYGGNDSSGNDQRPADMVKEAVAMADDDVDFKNYDWDGDGEVDQVFVIYAGYGENSNLADAIWPHEWTLTYAEVGAMTADGVKIDTYAVSNELTGTDGFVLEGIGTACHEFSHCLGYPDFYDTGGGSGVGMQMWDLLDYGCYGGYEGHGECPMGYTAYERWVAGWIKPTVLSEPCYVRGMRPLADDPGAAYVIYNDQNRKEYFLLENRQSGRWDYGNKNGQLWGHGMLVTHVDYDAHAWEWNEVNNAATHQRMTVVAADNALAYNSMSAKGDPFPGSRDKHALTDDSTPSLTLYNANTDGTKLLHKPLTDISETDGSISFTFMGGATAPQLFEPTDVTANAFTATWSAVDGAQSYTLQAWPLSERKANLKPILQEDFTACTKQSNYKIDTNLDAYTETPGWEGYLVYPEVGSVKLGNSSHAGWLYTPIVSAPSGTYTVYFECKGYGNDEQKVYAMLCDAEEKTTIISQHQYDTTGEYAPFAYSNTAGSRCRVCLMPSKRAYLRSVQVFDGSHTVADITSGRAAPSRLLTADAQGGDTITIDGITGTSVRVEGLTRPAYECRVRAVIDGEPQPWGKTAVVTLATTAIAEHRAGTAADDRIFTLSGQYAGQDPERLPRGIYIVGGKKRWIGR